MYDPKGLDMIYPLGVASKYGNKELQISIGSFRRHVSGIRRIFVVGVDPGFELPWHVSWIPFTQDACMNKEAAIATVLARGMHYTETETVVIQGDDHIATQRFDIREMRAPAGPSLRASAAKNPQRAYSKALKQTSKYLARLGAKTEYHFDYHMPMQVFPRAWVACKDHWEASARIPFGYVCKSLYGNLYGVEPQIQSDYKANRAHLTIEDIYQASKDRQVISYGDKCAPLVFDLFREYLS